MPKLHINDCITADHAPKNIITLLVALSGLAALSWQVLWQLKASLALGVSAWGTAVTLAVTMGGMCIGALITGCILERIKSIKPLRLYGAIECAVGLAGLSLNASFAYIERLDIAVYQTAPDMAPAVYLLGITLSLGIQTLCLGATVPVIGLMARQTKIPIATLYGMNTLGAAVGALLSAFLFIPALGLLHTIWLNSAINLTVGLIAIVMGGKSFAADPYTNPKPAQYLELSFPKAMIVVFATGAATFMLEVAWFRSLTAAFMSTTDAFAIMLACVLVSLGLGARLVPFISTRRNVSLPALLGWAGIAILLATPLIERFDLYVKLIAHYEIIIFVQWFFLTLYVIGLPVLLLGLSLPWVLDAQDRPWKWGALYGLNSFAAILGALSAGWILLPNLGLARTAWIAGLLVGAVGIALTKKESRINLTALVAISLALTFFFESGLGRTRVQGASDFKVRIPTKIIQFYEGPDSTISAVEYQGGRRILFIDGFSTTEQAGSVEVKGMAYTGQYMDWMGHLPMLLHPDPKNALVICFGTGQTANAVRKENPNSLSIVDINQNVYKLANYFTANESVLNDPRVNPIVMDGRAFMRRTNKIYDVITLEPMPPTFAGVNALYSLEFYQLARSKMTPNGIIAQWLPYHLVPAKYSASIAKTFQTVFPNAILWNDPASGTGILLGSMDDNGNLGENWPGLERTKIQRLLTKEQIVKAVVLYRDQMKKYGAFGELITDDNQKLSYGKAAQLLRRARNADKENQDMIKSVLGRKSE
ncbi:MAG: fused MFS/spermidine synthase [Alphaproteobacteria bacterium]|nr:fused MFS/spermidine synthase [Alphaproteobacteria bacterium]MBP7759140.1 fused MFS/spermidine synthase [Alphaproteobacteria bacterium]MBP7762504.1 fused MFS/spermidine synthase [Alphaproteobacteria bacterium]MBP7905724.1 fused MFS/spermidine synthase [Alphaproteobacteria bacterium]